MSSLWRLCNTQWRKGKGEQTRERRRVREGQHWPAEKERCRHGKEKRGEEGLMKGRGERKGEQRGIQVKEIWDRLRQKERGRPSSWPLWAYHQDIVSQTMALSASFSHQSD